MLLKAMVEENSKSREVSKLYAPLMSYYLHQDHLMWSRIQTVIAVQAGSLGGAYTIRQDSPYIAVLLMVLGVILTVLLYFLLKRDEQIRDVIEKFMGSPFPLIPEPSWPALLRGRSIIRIVFTLLLFVDVGFAYSIWLTKI